MKIEPNMTLIKTVITMASRVWRESVMVGLLFLFLSSQALVLAFRFSWLGKLCIFKINRH